MVHTWLSSIQAVSALVLLNPLYAERFRYTFCEKHQAEQRRALKLAQHRPQKHLFVRLRSLIGLYGEMIARTAACELRCSKEAMEMEVLAPPSQTRATWRSWITSMSLTHPGRTTR
jgi:hypothetical protein